MKAFIQGIKDILTHTNATPFKIKGNKYYCFFCPHNTCAYDDPKLLREHTNKHTDKVSKVDFAVRPHYQHEIIRLDIDDFTCNCKVKASWHDMIKHLKKHNVDLDDVKDKMIPFTLTTTDMPCVLCDYNSCFMSIDYHMNLHSQNYICGNCGYTFCSKARLNFHAKAHDRGTSACHYCGKVFNRELHKKRHEDAVHKKKANFKCSYCDQAFVYEAARHKHMAKQHKEKFKDKVWHCNECSKTFTWVSTYRQHMRLVHNLGYSCSECNKYFSNEKTLNEHKLLHKVNFPSTVFYESKRKRKSEMVECVDGNVSGLEKPSPSSSSGRGVLMVSLD